MKNSEYKTGKIENYFSQNRISWKHFYKSERKIIAFVKPGKTNSVLDIGCGCGGLGLALKEKFLLENYTGIDINKLAIKTAKRLNKKGNFIAKDILDLKQDDLKKTSYDYVFSLSCFDWNNNYNKMFKKAWKLVRVGGYLIFTLRLTDKTGVNNLKKSFQYINYDEKKVGEKARYVILNAKKNFNYLKTLNPKLILANGYWGKPSPTAVCNYNKLCFSAIAIQKREINDISKLKFKLDLPDDILLTIDKY